MQTQDETQFHPLPSQRQFHPLPSQRHASFVEPALAPLEFKLLQFLAPLFALQNSAPVKTIHIQICVSGGHDSMALLYAFSRVSRSRLLPPGCVLSLLAHHFNHERRGAESEADESFVIDSCLRLGVPVVAERFSQRPAVSPELNAEQSQKLSEESRAQNFQNTARMWRQARAVAVAQNAAKALGISVFFVALAHHQNDNVESILLHLIRGSGLAGLSGLDAVDHSRRLLRPFAHTPFSDLQAYAQHRKILFREDSSNALDVYDRNFVRHHVVPLLQQLNPRAPENLTALASNAREALAQLNFLEAQHQAPELLDRTVFKFTSHSTAGEIQRHVRRHHPQLAALLTRDACLNILAQAQALLEKKSQHANTPPDVLKIVLREGWWLDVSAQTVTFTKT